MDFVVMSDVIDESCELVHSKEDPTEDESVIALLEDICQQLVIESAQDLNLCLYRNKVCIALTSSLADGGEGFSGAGTH